MLSSLKKKILGTPTTPKATPVQVVATAVASSVSLLARETSGRNIRKIVDTNTVYNQFEQLKRFQHSNSPSDICYKDKLDKPFIITPEKTQKQSSPRAKLPVALLLVAIVSAITASVIVLLYTHLYVNVSGPVLSSALESPHHATSGYVALHQPPRPVEQYLPLPQPQPLDAVAVVPPPSASICKIIRIRNSDLPGLDREQLGPSTKQSLKRPKHLARLSLKKLWDIVSSVVMVPGELKDEKDFHFY